MPLILDFVGSTVSAVLAGTGPNQGGVTSADLDGDGDIDMVAADAIGGAIQILVNKGDGSFERPKRYGTGLQPYGLVARDFDGDGHPDVAVANTFSLHISVFKGNGDGTLQEPRNYPTAFGLDDLVSADANGDGHLDLIGLGALGGVITLLNDRKGGFLEAKQSSSGAGLLTLSLGITTGDFNGDGKIDLATTDWDRAVLRSRIGYVAGNGDGTFTPEQSYNVLGASEAIKAGDINCDGRPDLVVPMAQGGIVTLLGRPNGGFEEPEVDAKFPGTNAVALADFDNDGRLDMAVSLFLGSVAVIKDLCSGNRNFDAQAMVPLTAESIEVADINNDGLADMMVGTWFLPLVGVITNASKP